MNILLLASHGIAEFDDVRMFSRLGLDVFCPGGYADPLHPGETLRPAIPEAPRHPELALLCEKQREKHAGESADWAIDWAKADLHPDLIDWAEVIICHHFPERWLGAQWARLKGKRVIWRTCGQSNLELEQFMLTLRRDGLQIVRYSPQEQIGFGPAWAGEDATIRFGKYPADYGPWIGDGVWVGNVTQDMVGRGDATGLGFWLTVTEGLPVKPAGPRSDLLRGGVGALSYDEMREYLRRCRAYLYTGTYAASYTLGLIEAMLSGTPVISIGPRAFGSDLFEGHLIAQNSSDRPDVVASDLRSLLNDAAYAQMLGDEGRERAIELFGMDTVGPQWLAFLGVQAAAVAA